MSESGIMRAHARQRRLQNICPDCGVNLKVDVHQHCDGPKAIEERRAKDVISPDVFKVELEADSPGDGTPCTDTKTKKTSPLDLLPKATLTCRVCGTKGATYSELFEYKTVSCKKCGTYQVGNGTWDILKGKPEYQKNASAYLSRMRKKKIHKPLVMMSDVLGREDKGTPQ